MGNDCCSGQRKRTSAITVVKQNGPTRVNGFPLRKSGARPKMGKARGRRFVERPVVHPHKTRRIGRTYGRAKRVNGTGKSLAALVGGRYDEQVSTACHQGRGLPEKPRPGVTPGIR